MSNTYQIINFYEFKHLGGAEDLAKLKPRLRDSLFNFNIFGTIIIAAEGFNASLCGLPENIGPFIAEVESILETVIDPKSSFHESSPFRKHEVRIKPEIVTLKREVDISLGIGTHIDPKDWNNVISDPEVLLIDTRNDYEFHTGTFRNAINPSTAKFSDLPEFVENELDPAKHKKVAMFCTGGIRCEKFAPYMRAKGFTTVYQLSGGILKYLEVVPENEQLWDGECFVFDERVTLDASLNKGDGPDRSLRHHDQTEAKSFPK